MMTFGFAGLAGLFGLVNFVGLHSRVSRCASAI